MAKRHVSRSRHPRSREAVPAGSSSAPQEPPGKPTALGAHVTGTQRDVMASDPGRYVLVCHRMMAANSRSTC
jgi:hypothetical protein